MTSPSQNQRRLLAILCLPFILGFQGCSWFASDFQLLTIRAQTPVAQMKIDGEVVGYGSGYKVIRKDKFHVVEGKVGKDRHVVLNLEPSISTVGWVDLITGCIFLVPLIGLWAPGFCEIYPPDVDIVIPPSYSEFGSRKSRSEKNR